VGGGVSPHRASISRSLETASLRCKQQQDENGALPALSDRKGVIAVADLKGSQQAKQHAQTS
jgi:hypothetical protein